MWNPVTLTYTEPTNDIVSKTHWETEFKKLIDASNLAHAQITVLSTAYEDMVASVAADALDLIVQGTIPMATVEDLSETLSDIQDEIVLLNARPAGVQSDWNEAVDTEADYIKNKPTILTDLEDMAATAASRHLTDTYIAVLDRKTTTAYGTEAVTDTVFSDKVRYAAKNGDLYVKYAL
jgi:hypothetical protein